MNEGRGIWLAAVQTTFALAWFRLEVQLNLIPLGDKIIGQLETWTRLCGNKDRSGTECSLMQVRQQITHDCVGISIANADISAMRRKVKQKQQVSLFSMLLSSVQGEDLRLESLLATWLFGVNEERTVLSTPSLGMQKVLTNKTLYLEKIPKHRKIAGSIDKTL